MAGKIFLTGDTHGMLEIQKVFDWASKCKPRNFDKDDYLIILGDFGLIWSGSELELAYLDYLNHMPFTTLVIDGNHENFDLIEKKYPDWKEWNGGHVRVISDSIFMLKRGDIFKINDKTFIALGGATSIDKPYRTERKDWWPQENISSEDLDNAFHNLAQCNNDVDYVITHCAPSYFSKLIMDHFNYKYYRDINDMHLEDIRTLPLKYRKWYCGHYHVDFDCGKFSCLYSRFVELDDELRYDNV